MILVVVPKIFQTVTKMTICWPWIGDERHDFGGGYLVSMLHKRQISEDITNLSDPWSLWPMMALHYLRVLPVFFQGIWRRLWVCTQRGKWIIRGRFLQRGMICCPFSIIITENIRIFYIEDKPCKQKSSFMFTF